MWCDLPSFVEIGGELMYGNGPSTLNRLCEDEANKNNLIKHENYPREFQWITDIRKRLPT